VWIPALRLEDLFEDIFTPIARDGAALVEVQVRLQKALQALAERGEQFRTIAEQHAEVAFRRAEAVLVLEDDVALLHELIGKPQA